MFPKSESEQILEAINYDKLPLKLQPKAVRKTPFTEALFPYKDKEIQALIWGLKYRKKPEIAGYFGIFLYEHLLGELGENAFLSDLENTILIPVPVTKKRLRERGYNQAKLLAEAIKKQSGGSLVSISNVLFKKVEQEHQTHTISRKQRITNIRNTFIIKNQERVKNKNVIIIDDVITTGATISEAARILKAAGARTVRALTVAH